MDRFKITIRPITHPLYDFQVVVFNRYEGTALADFISGGQATVDAAVSRLKGELNG